MVVDTQIARAEAADCVDIQTSASGNGDGRGPSFRLVFVEADELVIRVIVGSNARRLGCGAEPHVRLG